jgi:hypothetical protein
MNRVLGGGGVGAGLGVLALAGVGAYLGFRSGTDGGGWGAAATWAFVFLDYYGWLAAAVGGAVGGVAGLGSWLVRPRGSGSSSPH